MLRATVAAGLLAASLGAATAADWRDDVKVLRIGFLAGANASYRTAQLEPFRAYLQEKLGLPVELIPAGTYDALIEAQAGARIQYAIYSAASFASASAACRCVEPVAVPTAAEGEEGFHAILVARADGPIRSLADARGARLALAGTDSVAGRLIPLKAFAREGIVPAQYFSAILDKPDPKAAMAALLAGEADLAVGWSSLTGDFATGYSFGVLSQMVADADLSMDEIRIVWQSPLIPFGPHAIRSDLPDEFKSLLTESLLTMSGEAPDALDAVDREGGGGFAAVNGDLYAGIADLIAPASAGTR
ncbi:MAG: phosphate/phosphite/phosphonate ABC transporter substrate-binding protein, partial [Bauldia sp.]